MTTQDDKPKFKTSRRQLVSAARQFLVMLEQRLYNPQADDPSYFQMPNGSHFDELVAQLQKRCDVGTSLEDMLEEARESLDSVTEKQARKPKVDKLRPATKTERRWAAGGSGGES